MFSRVALLGCCAAAALGADIEFVSGDGATTPPLQFRKMKDQMPAWLDLEGSKVVEVPLSITGVPTGEPGWTIPAGSKTTFACPSYGKSDCNAWVWVYSCPWSCPEETNDSLGSMLRADGWQPNLCAPRFETGKDYNAYRHRMVAYRYHLAPGQSVSFTTPKEISYVLFGLEVVKDDCASLLDMYSCNAVSNQKCQWTLTNPIDDAYPHKGICEAQTCKGPGQGPPPPCTKCP